MKKLLEKAGVSFLRAFVGSIIILVPGVLSAPDLNQAYALGVASLIASFTAGVKVLQVFAPQITFRNLFGKVAGAYADSFIRSFVGTFLVLMIGVLNSPDLGTARSLGVAALVGAVTAGVRAVQGLLTKGEFPVPTMGA